MSDQKLKRTKIEDISRVEDLLSLLGDLSQRDPSPALREQLAWLASQRLRRGPHDASPHPGTGPPFLRWFKPAAATVLLVLIGLSTIFVVQPRPTVHQPENNVAMEHHSTIASGNKTVTGTTARPAEGRSPRPHHRKPELTRPASTRRMTMMLPYSNSAIETGTGGLFSPFWHSRSPGTQPNCTVPAGMAT